MAQAEIKSTDVLAPYNGLDLTTPPHRLSKTRTPKIENFLVHEPSRLPVRPLNDTTQYAAAKEAIGLDVVAAQPPNGSVRVKESLNGTTLPPPYTTDDLVETKVDLAKLKVYDDAGDITTDIPTIGRHVKSAGTTYAFAGDASSAVSASLGALTDVVTTDVGVGDGLSGRVQWVRPLCAIASDGTVTAGDCDHDPHTGIAVEAHLNRLFVLGGYSHLEIVEEGTGEETAFDSSVLFYMTPDLLSGGGIPTNYLGSDDVTTYNPWTKDGVENRIEIPGEDQGVALIRLDQNLVILKRNSIWVLYGSDPDTFTVRQVEQEVGCVRPASVIVADGGIYFISARGLEFFDGSELSTVSGAVSPVMPQIQSVVVYSEQYLLCDNYLYCRTNKNWTTVSGDDVLPPPDPTHANVTGDTPENWNGGSLAGRYPLRIQGTPVEDGNYTRRVYYTKFGFVESQLSTDRGSLFYQYGTGGTAGDPTALTASVQTRVHNVAALSKRVLLSRMLLNALALSNDDPDSDNAPSVWTLLAYDVGHKQTTPGESPVPLFTGTMKSERGFELEDSDFASLYPGGRVDIWDCHVEAESLVFTVDYDSSAVTSVQEASLFGVSFEWQQTHNRRSSRYLSAS